MWRTIQVVSLYKVSHYTRCHTIQGVTLNTVSHYTRCRTIQGVTLYKLSHYTSFHTKQSSNYLCFESFIPFLMHNFFVFFLFKFFRICNIRKGSTWDQHGRQPQRWPHEEENLKVSFPPPPLGFWTSPRLSETLAEGAGTLLLNLFLRDVIVAAGGHVCLNLTSSYL